MVAKIPGLLVAVHLLVAVGGVWGQQPGTETLLPTHADRDAYVPSVAFGKDAFLVVWQSGRTAPGDLTKGLKFHGDIVGIRVGKDGKTLDEKPFVICEAADLQELPRVAYGNGTFLVVWQDIRNGKDWDVYAARVSDDGMVLDPDGVLVAGGAHNQALPRVAWDGKVFVVVWQDFRTGERYEVYAARLGAEGKVLDPNSVLVAGLKGSAHCYVPTVASTGDGRSFIYWLSRGSLGVPSTSSGSLFAGGSLTPVYKLPEQDGKKEGTGPAGQMGPVSLAAGSKAYLMAWCNRIPGGRGGFGASGNKAVNAALFNASGRERIKTLNIGGGSRQVVNPEVCWDGQAFVAVWHDLTKAPKGPVAVYDAVYFSRISPAGEMLADAALLAGTAEAPAMTAAAASNGAGTTLLAYEKHPDRGDVPIKIGFRLLSLR